MNNFKIPSISYVKDMDKKTDVKKIKKVNGRLVWLL